MTSHTASGTEHRTADTAEQATANRVADPIDTVPMPPVRRRWIALAILAIAEFHRERRGLPERGPGLDAVAAAQARLTELEQHPEPALARCRRRACPAAPAAARPAAGTPKHPQGRRRRQEGVQVSTSWRHSPKPEQTININQHMREKCNREFRFAIRKPSRGRDDAAK